MSALDALTEKPAKDEAAYLVDMARVEALDTMGEKEKAVAILERHVLHLWLEQKNIKPAQ